jgi:hypothetical protein
MAFVALNRWRFRRLVYEVRRLSKRERGKQDPRRPRDDGRKPWCVAGDNRREATRTRFHVSLARTGCVITGKYVTASRYSRIKVDIKPAVTMNSPMDGKYVFTTYGG